MKWLNVAQIIFIFSSLNAAVQASEIGLDVTDTEGKTVGSYGGSYALLIGNSDYQSNGWQSLPQISTILDHVAITLEKQDFQVVKRLNLNTKQFERVVDKFIEEHGVQKENRLLFFFAGHSYIHFLSQKGYFITTDTPLPEQGQFKFLDKAIVIDKVTEWAEKIQSAHALFMFDSCLAGPLFNSPEITLQPIENKTMLPIRSFIAACGIDETLAQTDMFSRIFINALQYGWGDLNADGYVTGSELAHYIGQELPLQTKQTPQIGIIKNSELSQGDFVFTAAHETVSEEDAKLFPIIATEEEIVIDVIAEQTTVATEQLVSDEIVETMVADKPLIATEKTVEKIVIEQPIEKMEPTVAEVAPIEVKPIEKVVETVVEQPVVAMEVTEQPVDSTEEKEGYILHTITKNDSLWNIAIATLPKKGMSIDKHMKNIYRLNPQAFIKNNINLLVSGQVLKIPTASEDN